MSLSKTAMLGVARFEREALGRTVQYTPADRWESDSASEGWRNRDVLAHLAASETAAAQVLGGEVPDEVATYLKSQGRLYEGAWTDSVDGFNASAVERRRDTPLREVAMEWGRAADLLLARASAMSEDDWATKRVPWVVGDLSVRFFIQTRVSEWWNHGEDIRAGAGLPTRLEHDPIHLVNDLAIKSLPYALGLAAIAHPGRSVLIELEGAGGGTWHYGLAPRQKPAPDKAPDAVIETRGYPFAMVATRKIPASYYLEDGTIAIGGDEDIALDVLENVRSFA